MKCDELKPYEYDPDFPLQSDRRFHDAEIRKTKRALWIARACRAHAEWTHWATIWFRDTDAILNINKARLSQSPYRCTTKRNAAIWRNMWHRIEHKCRVKAEEYEP